MFIKFEGVSFNKVWVAAQTFEKFCAHEKHHGFSTAQMQEIYDLCKVKEDAKAAKPASKPAGK